MVGFDIIVLVFLTILCEDKLSVADIPAILFMDCIHTISLA